jgi:opacity protein-like surface antigen
MGFGPRYGAFTAVDADGMEQSGGASVRVKLLSFLGVEGSIDYAEQAFYDGFVTARCWPVMLTGLVYPMPMLYGVYGVDWNHMEFEYASGTSAHGVESAREVAWHAGAGLEIPLGTAVTLVGEFRYIFIDGAFDSVPALASANTDSYFVTIGFLISLLPPESGTAD